MAKTVKAVPRRSRPPATIADHGKPKTSETGPERAGAAGLILDTAARLMRQKGYEATTIRGIAREVGIKAGSIYHHFPSKDDIVQRVVDEGVKVVHEAVVSALAALPSNASPRKRLETAVRAHLLSSLRHSDYTSASIRAFAFLPPKVRAECRVERRKYEDVWRTVIADLGRAGLIPPGTSQDSVRLLLLGAVNWAGEWYRPGRLGIDKIARDFAASICPTGP